MKQIIILIITNLNLFTVFDLSFKLPELVIA